jgi:hypothetical protein
MFRKQAPKVKKQWQLDLDDAEEAKEPETKGGVIVCCECESTPSLKCVECDSCNMLLSCAVWIVPSNAFNNIRFPFSQLILSPPLSTDPRLLYSLL